MKPVTVQTLDSLYVERIGCKPQYRETSASIVTALNTIGIKEPMHYIQRLFAEKPFLIENIQDKRIHQDFYRMSSVLYVYAGIHYSPEMTEHAMNGYYKQLEDVGLDLGKVWYDI